MKWKPPLTLVLFCLQRDQRPLTRYLPIKDVRNFDLKSHIESAGHQADLCEHVSLDSNSCQGYLQKLTLGKIRNTWHKKWFVFNRESKKLSYFSSRKSSNDCSSGKNTNQKVVNTVLKEPKDCTQIEFTDLEDVYVDHSWKNSKNVIFCMKTAKRGFTLMAPSSEAMRIWVDVVFTGAEGHTTID